ncbi:TIGR01244 family phosphatase [Acidovorax sp. DW039]|uniref:TIGR01244 family sulfur transferase n=1 Tax=Acidovorax sp. DW039 TaxID=3095606 RepID=UPI00308CC8D0|nr:TIGR01244 family phosphatase [Acidovorax sp. DW039]
MPAHAPANLVTSNPWIAVTPYFSVSPQLRPEDMGTVAAHGFKAVVNNRPDGEGGNTQPTSQQMENAARAAGLAYAHLPVVGGAITSAQAAEMRELLNKLPSPVLAFCRSGARSAQLFGLARENAQEE